MKMNQIRFATIGLGRIGRAHVNEMKNAGRFELAAVCDNSQDRLENLPAAWGSDYRKYSSLDELLADDSVDLISVGVRHLDHVPMAIRILETGKYCVVEKPVASCVREMKRLQTCAEAHPRKLFIRHNRRFEPAFNKAKELAESGLIGVPQYFKLYRSVGYCRRNDWMTVPEYYGGLLTNWGPHLIDHALRFLNSPVTDLWADVRHVISIGEGDDLFKIILKAENGRLADVEVTGANTMPGREVEIIGSRGTIVYEGGNRIHVRTVDPSIEFKPLRVHRENPPFQYGNFDEKLTFVDMDYDLPPLAISDMWKHVAADILDGIPYPVKFEEALEVVRVTEEAFRKSGFAPMQAFIR